MSEILAQKAAAPKPAAPAPLLARSVEPPRLAPEVSAGYQALRQHPLFAPLLLTLFVQGQNTKLGVKLGPNEAAWQVAPYQGKLDAVAINADGRPAAAVGPNGLVLTTTAAIAQDTELFVRFRITLPKGQGSGLTVVAGQKKPGDSGANALSLQLHIYPSPEPETVTWTLDPLPGEKHRHQE